MWGVFLSKEYKHFDIYLIKREAFEKNTDKIYILVKKKEANGWKKGEIKLCAHFTK